MGKPRFTSTHIAAYLKMDAFGQKQFIRLAGDNIDIPIISRKAFFAQIYVPINENSILIHDGTTNEYEPYNYDTWLNDLVNNLDSVVVYIEGYAGCGKSVFVQKVLSEFFPRLDYDQNYYNYDIGAIFNNTERKRIRDAIVECFIREFVFFASDEKLGLINKFEELLRNNAISNLDNNRDIEYLILQSKEYQNWINQIRTGRTPDAIENLRNALHSQLKNIETGQALYIDSILRIAKYITDNDPETLVVCYDNLDAIENNDELCEFDNVLGSVRENIDNYIKALPSEIFEGKPSPHFVYLATFRKVTAVRVGLHEDLERAGDNYEQRQHIFYIEGSHLYDFREMIKKRYDYFLLFCETYSIKEECTDILNNIQKVRDLVHTDFVHHRYAGLWNNNYRTCCDIMEIMLSKHSQEINQCLSLLKQNIDEYDDRLSVGTGASAVFLSIICKVQKEKNYWDERHLHLTDLSRDAEIPKLDQLKNDTEKIQTLTSPSRLILTYIRNVSYIEKRPIPISELDSVFGKIYSNKVISDCLANMLYRENNGLWRRPIYLSNNIISPQANLRDAISLQLLNAASKHPPKIQYSEVMVCDCGDAFINRVSCDFEYYAVRLGYNTSIYLVNDSQKIVDTVNNVFLSVEDCCKKLKVFSTVYKYLHSISSKEDYNTLYIHPMTHGQSTQLHTERIIFNHIEYLDRFRIYASKRVSSYRGNVDLRDFLLSAMKKYINLYFKYPKSLDERRLKIAKTLETTIDHLLTNTLDNKTRVYVTK